jgi:hypothetical protein
VTTEDVRLALEGYEQKYRQLREALGSRPTRPTRRPDSTAQAAAARAAGSRRRRSRLDHITTRVV